MTTLTNYCRRALPGEEGMTRAPWWCAKPAPTVADDIERDLSDPVYRSVYKRQHNRDTNRALKLSKMLAGEDPRSSNCSQNVAVSMTDAAVKSRNWRLKKRMETCKRI